MRLIREEVVETQKYPPIGQRTVILYVEAQQAIILRFDQIEELAVVRDRQAVGIVQIGRHQIILPALVK